MRLSKTEIKIFMERRLNIPSKEEEQMISDYMEEKWFKGHNIAEIQVDDFFKWLCDIVGDYVVKKYIECSECGYTAMEHHFARKLETRKSEGKVVHKKANGEFELTQKEFQLLFYICPNCHAKLLHEGGPVDML